MEKYIPYEKLSKKRKRQVDAQRRGTWGEINPVTRKPDNSKAYNRSKARQWRKDLHDEPCFYGSADLMQIRKPQKPFHAENLPQHLCVLTGIRGDVVA